MLNVLQTSLVSMVLIKRSKSTTDYPKLLSSWFYLSVTQKGRFESTVPNGPNGPLLNLGAFKN